MLLPPSPFAVRMGASSSRVEQMEALVHALQGANAQLERQLLAVSRESDAGKRAELLLAIQAENNKTRKENEAHQRELTDEVSLTVCAAGVEVRLRAAHLYCVLLLFLLCAPQLQRLREVHTTAAKKQLEQNGAEDLVQLTKYA